MQRIFICQPGYGNPKSKSAQSFWVGCVNSNSPINGKLTFATGESSLLAASFNNFWCHALNLQDAFDKGLAARNSGQGRSVHKNPYDPFNSSKAFEAWEWGWHRELDQRVTYFAMLHDDISCDRGWLEVLYNELVAHDVDMVSAVVPLKDAYGLTSTAIDDPDNRFQVIRRLTMAEVFALPETFSAADCGYPSNYLLLNTGCWICRLDRDFIREKNHDGSLKLRFSIDDKIVQDPNTGEWTGCVTSEDWEFSRIFQDLGGTVRATRKVKLDHWGLIPFTNRIGTWGQIDHDVVLGQKFDHKPIGGAHLEPSEEFLENIKSRDSGPCKPFGWSSKYPDVRGWFRDIEGECLAKYAKDKNVVEIGSYCGLSTIWLSNSAKSVCAVDTFESTGTPEEGDTEGQFKTNVRKYGKGNIYPLRMKSSEALPKLEGVDFIFIDGTHTYESVKEDIRLSLNALKPGGTLAFHDYGAGIAGVDKAVDELIANGGKLLDHVGWLAVVEAPVKSVTAKAEYDFSHFTETARQPTYAGEVYSVKDLTEYS